MNHGPRQRVALIATTLVRKDAITINSKKCEDEPVGRKPDGKVGVQALCAKSEIVGCVGPTNTLIKQLDVRP